MMKTRRTAAAVLCAFLYATTAPPPAAAQDDLATVQARARFNEGVEAFDKGNFEAARLAFLQAYALKQHPAVLLNLAQSSARTDRPLDAAKHFQQFLNEATTATPQQRQDAEAGLAEARQKLGRIEIVAPPGTEISLDDQGPVGRTPMDPIDVLPGSYLVRSTTHSASVTAAAGQIVEARLDDAEAAAGTGSAALEGELTSSDPPGADGGPKWHTKLLTPPKNMTPVYIGLGAAGVGLASAVAFGIFKADAQAKADDGTEAIRRAAAARGLPAAGICSNPTTPDFASSCQTVRDNNDKVDVNAAVANVSLAVMGAGLVFAGGWYLFAPKKSAETTATAPLRPTVTPYAGWGNAGLSLSGSF